MPDVVFFNLIIVPYLAAGCLGGLVHVFRVRKRTTPWEVIGYIVTGGLAANFFAPQLLKFVTAMPGEAIAFGIGMTGKHLCYAFEKLFMGAIPGKIENE